MWGKENARWGFGFSIKVRVTVVGLVGGEVHALRLADDLQTTGEQQRRLTQLRLIAHTHTHTHTLAHTLTLTHSLTHSLNHSRTHALTHSLTHSLTRHPPNLKQPIVLRTRRDEGEVT